MVNGDDKVEDVYGCRRHHHHHHQQQHHHSLNRCHHHYHDHHHIQQLYITTMLFYQNNWGLPSHPRFWRATTLPFQYIRLMFFPDHFVRCIICQCGAALVDRPIVFCISCGIKFLKVRVLYLCICLNETLTCYVGLFLTLVPFCLFKDKHPWNLA